MEVTVLCKQLWLMLLIVDVQKGFCKSFKTTFQIIPSRLQLFEYETIEFTCDGFNISAGWTVRNTKENISKCTLIRTCGIDYAFSLDSGEYWCESGAERSNSVNITVSAGSVILESPVHPVMEGEDVTLRCRNKTTSSNFTADFHKDSVLIGTSYTGELKITNVFKSHEGFYKCKIRGVGESPESWLAISKYITRESGATESPSHPVTEAKALTLVDLKAVLSVFHKKNILPHLYNIMLWIVVSIVLALQLLVLGLLYWKLQLVLLLIKMHDPKKDQFAVTIKCKRRKGTANADDDVSMYLETNHNTNPQTRKDEDQTFHSTFIFNDTPKALRYDSEGYSFLMKAGLSDPPLSNQEHTYSTIEWAYD